MDSTDEKDEEIKELRELVKILNQENQVLMEREHILQTEVITLHEILVAAQRHSACLAQENHAFGERNATLGLKLSIIAKSLSKIEKKRAEAEKRAFNARHGRTREIKEQVIREWKEYEAQQTALGRMASKNQFAAKAAEKHGYSANTIRKNWLQGI